MKAKMAKTRLAVGRRGKAGFTLIELLVVISIIAILTLIATANFTAVQQQARIGFAADTLVSTLREAQVLAKSGQRVGGTPATISGVRRESPVLQCRAVKIVPGVGADAGLFSGQSAYIGVADANAPVGSGDNCTVLADSGWQKSEIFGDRLAIISASGADSSSAKEYYFKPPFGQIYQNEGGVLARVKPDVVTIVVGETDHPETQKTLRFDLVTGAVERK